MLLTYLLTCKARGKISGVYPLSNDANATRATERGAFRGARGRRLRFMAAYDTAAAAASAAAIYSLDGGSFTQPPVSISRQGAF